MEHTLVKYEYQSGNNPPYRHYVACTCGFQARMETEAAVKHQFDAHLIGHGIKPYFENGGPDIPVEDTSAQDIIDKQKQTVFNPFGG